MDLVLGADIGGTSTRVAVLAADGRVLGTGRSAGGNLRSVPADLVRERLGEALRQAAAGLPTGARIVAAHLGIAGAGGAGRAAAESVVREAWPLGEVWAAAPTVGDDLSIAFAAGSTGGDGLLLLAGTGAVACRFAAGRPVARADGLGWLLGDRGSGVWFGLGALRAVAGELDGTGPSTALTAIVLDELGLRDADPRQGLIAAAHDVPVAAHGRWAPAVMTAARAGDDVAVALVQEGVAALLRTAGAIGSQVPEVVLAGSLLVEDTPVRAGVLEGLTVPALDARAPVVGALALAARAAGWPEVDRAALTAGLSGDRRTS
ncbi:N-acetylglucosamine kinase [Cellulomonas taurus]|uniref:N-acetylglucosamine kinase n=1 Tax=Cellulomonas taurus TaxID=2729175 RepID=UPI00145E6913|nr:BadF/BadG/BcrA/BcrD ATPase family protein [Cellulomonas taurus]